MAPQEPKKSRLLPFDLQQQGLRLDERGREGSVLQRDLCPLV